MTINRLRRTQPIPSASLVTASAVASQAHNEDGRVQTKRTTKSIKRHQRPGNRMRRS